MNLPFHSFSLSLLDLFTSLTRCLFVILCRGFLRSLCLAPSFTVTTYSCCSFPLLLATIVTTVHCHSSSHCPSPCLDIVQWLCSFHNRPRVFLSSQRVRGTRINATLANVEPFLPPSEKHNTTSTDRSNYTFLEYEFQLPPILAKHSNTSAQHTFRPSSLNS